MSNFIKAALIRAARTICQTAASTIAVFITGETMGITAVDWGTVVSVSLLAGILSILTSISTGLPEADYAEHIYMSVEEPEDSEVKDGEE